MPPDTKALEHGMLSDAEFMKQVQMVFEEEKKRLFYELENFDADVLFHYFSVIDQVCHTFWRTIDPEHPLYTEELNKQFGNVIPNLYQQIDEVLGKVLSHVDKNTTVLIISDHGFTSFRRGVNLNTILLNNGYISLLDPSIQGENEFFLNVDWTKTKAYNLGINSLYINLVGREPEGLIWDYQYDNICEEVREVLLNFVDLKTGKKPIAHVAKRSEIYHGPYLEQAPDLIIGYENGYRASWDTILGKMPKEEVVDNLSTWSGDHCVYFNLVPGVIVCNQKLNKQNPNLMDVAPSILDKFSITDTEDMDGKTVF